MEGPICYSIPDDSIKVSLSGAVFEIFVYDSLIILVCVQHFWVAVSMVFFMAASIFTLLKLSGNILATCSCCKRFV